MSGQEVFAARLARIEAKAGHRPTLANSMAPLPGTVGGAAVLPGPGGNNAVKLILVGGLAFLCTIAIGAGALAFLPA